MGGDHSSGEGRGYETESVVRPLFAVCPTYSRVTCPLVPGVGVRGCAEAPARRTGRGQVSQPLRSIVKRLVPVAIVSAWTEPRARAYSPVPPVIPLSNEGGGPGMRWPKTMPCTES